jgi:hypothetical protein
MKTYISFSLFTLLFSFCGAQNPLKTRNVFIVTLDGFRWQEVFRGADSALLADPRYVRDSYLVKSQFWDRDLDRRRKLLLPFFWNVLAEKGQILGNRDFQNRSDVKNIYRISYPGYNEIFTGFADPVFIPNLDISNRNKNVLEFLNESLEFKGKVVAFTSWRLFPYIFNKKKTSFYLNSGFEDLGAELDSSLERINQFEENLSEKGHTRQDEITFLGASQYLREHLPRVVFLGLGETDEFAHDGRYDLYLQKATEVDRMLSQLWYEIQTNPFYKDQTTLIITTDHGRGKKNRTWHSHGFWVPGSSETWMAVIGPDTDPLGEIRVPGQVYQKQIAGTISGMLGLVFGRPADYKTLFESWVKSPESRVLKTLAGK